MLVDNMADDEKGLQRRSDEQAELNAAVWSRGAFVDSYDGGELKEPERQLLDRHRARLSGSVLELGCGAGRLTGHLIGLAEHVHGVDIAPAMVEHCRRAYPAASFDVADIRDLSRWPDAGLDAVIAAANVLDVLGDAERRRVIAQIARLLAPGGLLLLSAHNLAYASRIPGPLLLAVERGRGSGSPRGGLAELARAPRRVRNRMRLARLQERHPDFAVLVDEAHDYTLLHYYVARDEQERQLAAAGLRLLECVDLGGRPVARGETAATSSELHYVAEREPR
jgi:SAM-dependent methyltransferase